VREHLRKIERVFDPIDARITAKGLWKRFQKKSNGTYFAEDVEDMAARDKRTVDLLRPALWGPPGEDGKMVREIHPTTNEEEDPVRFTGALIMTMNARPNSVLPDVEALEDRIVIFECRPEREQLMALAHKIALGGFAMTDDQGKLHTLKPAQTVEMWRKFANDWPPLATPSLRFLPKCYRLRLEMLAAGEKDEWEPLMDLLLRQYQRSDLLAPPPGSMSESQRKKEAEVIAVGLRQKYGKDMAKILPEWTQLTAAAGLGTAPGEGLKRQAYYEALKRADQQR
jgi:hypothetical protein